MKAGFDVFWDEGRGSYVDHVVDGVARRPMSQHAGATALAAGLVPADRVDRVLDRILDRSRLLRHSFVMYPSTPDGPDDGHMYVALGYPEPTWDVEEAVIEAEPFFRYVVHDAVARAGRPDLIADLCRDWKVFLDAGHESWPECWTGGTNCHGWSSTPTRDLIVHTLGITPAEPGYASVRVVPALGDLDWARATVPTPHGPLTVEAHADGRLVIDSPVPVVRASSPGRRCQVSAEPEAHRRAGEHGVAVAGVEGAGGVVGQLDLARVGAALVLRVVRAPAQAVGAEGGGEALDDARGVALVALGHLQHVRRDLQVHLGEVGQAQHRGLALLAHVGEGAVVDGHGHLGAALDDLGQRGQVPREEARHEGGAQVGGDVPHGGGPAVGQPHRLHATGAEEPDAGGGHVEHVGHHGEGRGGIARVHVDRGHEGEAARVLGHRVGGAPALVGVGADGLHHHAVVDTGGVELGHQLGDGAAVAPPVAGHTGGAGGEAGVVAAGDMGVGVDEHVSSPSRDRPG